jgi:hypothetical protein
METLTQVPTQSKPRTRLTKHTRTMLKELKRPGWAFLLTTDHGLVRVTKKEARLIVRTGGDELTYQRRGGDIWLEKTPF